MLELYIYWVLFMIGTRRSFIIWQCSTKAQIMHFTTYFDGSAKTCAKPTQEIFGFTIRHGTKASQMSRELVTRCTWYEVSLVISKNLRPLHINFALYARYTGISVPFSNLVLSCLTVSVQKVLFSEPCRTLSRCMY